MTPLTDDEVRWLVNSHTCSLEMVGDTCRVCWLGNERAALLAENARLALRAALSTPTDTAALRAMLEKAAGMGMSCGYSRCCSKLEAKSDADRNEIVDRVLGGS